MCDESHDLFVLGLSGIEDIILEMGYTGPGTNLTLNRRTALKFRDGDSALFAIFQRVCKALSQLCQSE